MCSGCYFSLAKVTFYIVLAGTIVIEETLLITLKVIPLVLDIFINIRTIVDQCQ